MMMSCDDAGTRVVQRFEVFTGAGRRRVWTADDKAMIVADSFSGRETVCAVARRHGLSPSQLFAWRRLMRRDVADPALPLFVPAVIAASALPAVSTAVAASTTRRRRLRRSPGGATAVELEIDGVAVKIARGADARVIAAVIDALKATR